MLTTRFVLRFANLYLENRYNEIYNDIVQDISHKYEQISLKSSRFIEKTARITMLDA